MAKDVIIVHINCAWDNEACVWIATSPDVKGLVLEDGSLDKLMYRVEQATPELLELNQLPKQTPFTILAEKRQAALA